MKNIDKRACRKFAFPESRFQKNNGLLHHPDIKYIARAAVKNVGGRRMLLLYLYKASEAASGTAIPTYTVFQTKDDFLTLERLENGRTKWRKAAVDYLNREYRFLRQCAFYSLRDEQDVIRYCGNNKQGFTALVRLQAEIQDKRAWAKQLITERKIANRMKTLPSLPRGLQSWIQRTCVPHYLFFNNDRKKVGMSGYCTACRKEVLVSSVKHNQQGICPNCKQAVTFKSRAMRGLPHDRGTVQVIQRVSKNEIVIRFVKYVNRFFDTQQPDYSIYENARIFLSWQDRYKVTEEHYYYSYGRYELTPWKKGYRPTFSAYQYSFEADMCGFLYDRNLDKTLNGTLWQYSQLPLYYRNVPAPMEVSHYLSQYLRHPLIEYLVKLGLYRLATSVVFEHEYRFGASPINLSGRNLQEVLGLGKEHLPFLKEINPGIQQLSLIKDMLREGRQPDKELMKWCAKFDVGTAQQILLPLRFMTAHKLMRYATQEFALFHRTSPYRQGHSYVSMSALLTDYGDYLLMCEGLNYDLKNDFVLFPRNLPHAHDAVNELSAEDKSEVYNKRIAMDYERLIKRYSFKSGGLLITAPRSAEELVTEGHKLHHCVGSYIKRVAYNECMILFVRETKNPDKPFCTLEVRDGTIYQARIYKNQAPPVKVQRFIDRWKKEVLYAAADLQAA